ncbi:uncharacterized protein LY89DRAFT_648248 [Mollisia scopiformis]|uniref:Uncharacterized protein n=1 Tax=Mollisia scopiformis TaxID=149040 RepID=A0A194X8H8_MOLSC|nr:uncharacterized protein LY89DRAFT_648248 [Mollisia scopiformis]KUJ16097.1 hypothetical protein LY89DRAFT_648248 [Mollisia scopiformis]
MEGFVSVLPPLLAISLVLSAGSSLDIILLAILEIYKHWQFIIEFVQANINPVIVIDISKYVVAVFTTLQIARFAIALSRSEFCSDEFPVKPMLFPCQTSHVRMFPKKHGFSYSYLLVGIPVGWKGNSRGMISAEEEDSRPWYIRWLSMKPSLGWWTVNSDDYLARGHVHDGLTGKLRGYLESQGVDHKKYAFAYLLTAAKFLGYASNPVSVWHLYSAKRELQALVLEVNNTSDERHTYFLEPSSAKLVSRGADIPDSIRYSGSLNKDFYVSTFNDRAGKYSVAAYDPLFPFMSGAGPVNTTITLSSANSRAMLIARVYSAGQALDPSSMSVWAKTKFLASWWWVGYLTFFPRTVYEAFRLLFRRGVPWVSRPEPRKNTLSRHADPTEIHIEKHFWEYLEDRVMSSENDITLQYISAGLLGPSSEGRTARSHTSGERTLEIRVLTPIFYSRIVQYADIYAGLLQEIQSKTITISDLTLLKLLSFEYSPILNPKISRAGICFALIKKMRSEVPPIPLLEKPDPGSEVFQIPSHSVHGLSALDHYVSATASPSEVYNYVRGVLKLLFAERIAHGWMEILNFEIFIVRLMAIWAVVKFVLP